MTDGEQFAVTGPKGKSVSGNADCDESTADSVRSDAPATAAKIQCQKHTATARPGARKRRAGRRRISGKTVNRPVTTTATPPEAPGQASKPTRPISNPKQVPAQLKAISRTKPQDAGKPTKQATAPKTVAKRALPESDPKPTNQVKNQNRLDRKRESERKIYRLGRTLEPCPEPKNWKRRESCKDSLEGYCLTYRPNTFCLPFSDDHREVIRDLEAVIKDGGQKGYAMSRGTGKTALLEAACEWAILYGYRRFPFVVTAAEGLAVDILDSIRTTFESNETVAEDFPEVCAAIMALDGEPRRCKGQLDNTSKHTGIKWMADCLVLPVVSIVHWKKKPAATGMGATLKVSGLTGRLRGTKRKLSDDTYQRPDLALIDDPQSDQSADSAEQTSKLEKLIHGAVLGLAGPKKKIAALCACTIIKPKDLSARMLDRKRHPEWAGTCHSLVYEWSTNKELWKTYLELRKTDQRNNDKTYKLSNEFYLANRTEMDKGSRVGWEHRFRDGEHSAIQCAYNLLCDVGEEAFMAEYQNQPIETESVKIKLTADQIMARCNGYAQGEIPPLSCIVTAFIDVNDHALAWGIGAFTREMAGAMIAYGEWGMNGNGIIGQTDRQDRIWDEKQPAPEGKEKRFWAALDSLGKYLFSDGLLTVQGRTVRISAALIDYGYNPRNVDERNKSKLLQNWCYAMKEKRLPVYPSRGWSSSGFPKPGDKTLWDSLSFGRKDFWSVRGYPMADGSVLQTVHHDAEHHRKEMQMSWLLPPGSPGSMTVWGRPGNGPGTDEMKHLVFAKQISAAQLIEYRPNEVGNYSGLYRWTYAPGLRYEASDIVVGCRVAAMAFGYTQGLFVGQAPGQPPQPPTKSPGQSGPASTPTAPKVAPPTPGVRISPGWGGRSGGF